MSLGPEDSPKEPADRSSESPVLRRPPIRMNESIAKTPRSVSKTTGAKMKSPGSRQSCQRQHPVQTGLEGPRSSGAHRRRVLRDRPQAQDPTLSRTPWEDAWGTRRWPSPSWRERGGTVKGLLNRGRRTSNPKKVLPRCQLGGDPEPLPRSSVNQVWT